MKDQNLLALVTRASKQADPDAFVEICNLKAREVIFLCARQMGNPHDGEDAAQEVFIRMQKSIARLQAPEAFNVWLNRLIHTTCVNMRRDSMKHKDAVPIESLDDSLLDDSEIALPQELAESAEQRHKLAALIDELPEKYRSCILLHYYQHLSYAQIAEVLGLSQDTVNNNMRMARKVLKLELENELSQSTKMWSVASLVALGPVLTASLQEAAVLSVSPAVIGQCLAAAGIPALLGAGGAAVANAAAAGASLAGNTAGKMVAQIAVSAALVLGIGCLAFMTFKPASPAPAAPAASAVLPLPGQQPAAVVDAPLLTGRVYLAGEGLDDPAQYGYAGAQLQLVSAQNPGQVLKTTTTGADGSYEFRGLPSGQYQLLLVLPAGATGVDNGHTSLAGETAAGQAATVLVGGQSALPLSLAAPHTGVDIALSIPTRLQGDIMLQQNGQPVPYNSALMAGAYMELLDSEENRVATTEIDGNGHYVFDELPITQRGSYGLRIVTPASGSSVSTEVTSVELYPGFRN